MWGKKHSAQRKQDIGRKMKEHYRKNGLNPERLRKISEALKGRPSRNKGQPMSEKQKEKIRQTHLRRWDKVGRKPKRPRHERSEYLQWRKAIFLRDDFTCWICERKGGYLEAHHLKNWARFPELRFYVPNGLTLCRYCHKIYTKKGAYKECRS